LYSAAKELLAKEKAYPATDESLKQIRDVLTPEKTQLLALLVEKLNPLIEARQKAVATQQTFETALTHIIEEIQGLKTEFQSFKEDKSSLLAKEEQVLDKLLEVL
jgi:hypothetical protein